MNWWCLFPTIVLGRINEPSPPKDNGWKYLLIIFWEKDTHKIRVSGKDIFWFEEKNKTNIPVQSVVEWQVAKVAKEQYRHHLAGQLGGASLSGEHCKSPQLGRAGFRSRALKKMQPEDLRQQGRQNRQWTIKFNRISEMLSIVLALLRLTR